MLAVVVTASLLCGCASTPRALDTDERMLQVNQGYTLLYTLLDKDADVDKILLIKSADPRTEALIREIAAVCRAAIQRLRAFARDDPHLRFDSPSVPVVEQATRDAIESTVAKDLLSSWNEAFEVKLLLSQADAIGYGAHLAMTLRKFDTDGPRRAWLEQLSENLKLLYARVVARLALSEEEAEE